MTAALHYNAAFMVASAGGYGHGDSYGQCPGVVTGAGDRTRVSEGCSCFIGMGDGFRWQSLGPGPP